MPSLKFRFSGFSRKINHTVPKLERGGRSLEAERIRSAFTSTLGFRGARGGVGRFALEGITFAKYRRM